MKLSFMQKAPPREVAKLLGFHTHTCLCECVPVCMLACVNVCVYVYVHMCHSGAVEVYAPGIFQEYLNFLNPNRTMPHAKTGGRKELCVH